MLTTAGTMLALGAATSAITTATGLAQAKSSAKSAMKAAADQAKLRYEAIAMEKQQTMDQAQSQRRQANRKIAQQQGMLRLKQTTLSTTSQALQNSALGYQGGLSLSDIESNRKNRLDSLNHQIKSTALQTNNTIQNARDRYRDQRTNQSLAFGLKYGPPIIGAVSQIVSDSFSSNSKPSS
ncbi:MAG: hypothetical protein HQL54_04515 [Magnetococcales bacterium]|nr:hypothetical protein [Magnetococcales bacterium]